jgi:hypothetical protein
MTNRKPRNLLFVPLIFGVVSVASLPNLTLAQDSGKLTHEFLMEKMTGKWVMRGTIDNEKVTHDVTVDRILNKGYVRIHEIARERDAQGQPAYEAWIHLSWDKTNNEFAVMWLDNTGITNFSADGVGHGKPDGDSIPFIWKLADGSGIRNTFAYDRKTDSWSWSIDNVDKTGKSSPFGRVSLKRK